MQRNWLFKVCFVSVVNKAALIRTCKIPLLTDRAQSVFMASETLKRAPTVFIFLLSPRRVEFTVQMNPRGHIVGYRLLKCSVNDVKWLSNLDVLTPQVTGISDRVDNK